MGALTNLYVAATSGSDGTGTGTSGNPYKTTQFALNNFGRDATNGNYVNLSGDDVLSASLSFATWGAPTFAAPTIIGNWTGGPDGQGGLNGNGGNFTIFNGESHIGFRGIKIHNTGTAMIFLLGFQAEIRECEIYDSSSSNVCVANNVSNLIIGCNFYNCGTVNGAGSDQTIIGCYLFEGPTNTFTAGYGIAGFLRSVRRNIVVLKAGSSTLAGIYVNATTNRAIEHNSVYTSGGTGTGIMADLGNSMALVQNNLVEGFSGAGGKGINLWGGGGDMRALTNNAVYNCTTAYGTGDAHYTNDNETLSATPFAKSGANTFANRFTYFAPVDTGNVWGGAYPSGSGLDKGACQHAGGGAAPPNFNIIPQSA